MYCTKLLHHTFTKIWTLSCRGISEHHGIFLERKKHARPCIKVGCLRPAVTLCLLSFFPPKQTRVRFDSAIKSPVPQRDEEKGCEGKDPPSPPSRSTSSSNEPPVKQKAEQSCAQAPPQRPLVPLVSMILKQQQRSNIFKLVHSSNTSEVTSLGFHVVLSVRRLTVRTVKRVNWEEGKTKPDTGTTLIFSQQSASVPSNTYYRGLPIVLDPYTVPPSQHTFRAVNTFITRSHFLKSFWQRPAASGSGGGSLRFASQLDCERLGGIMLSRPLRSWDKIIAPNGIRELLMKAGSLRKTRIRTSEVQ